MSKEQHQTLNKGKATVQNPQKSNAFVWSSFLPELSIYTKTIPFLHGIKKTS